MVWSGLFEEEDKNKQLKLKQIDINGPSIQKNNESWYNVLPVSYLRAFIELCSLFTIWNMTVFHFMSVSANVSYFIECIYYLKSDKDLAAVYGCSAPASFVH